MPQVVQIQRAPNSWDQAGQTVQQTTDNFLKSMLAMGQMQNNNALHMATLNLQNQRLADANTRQDKQLAAAEAARKEEMAQRLQMHNDTMALHKQQLGRAYEAMNKSQLVTVKGPDGSDMPVLFNPVTQKVTPFTMPGMGGGAGGAMGGGSSIPGLDAATTAGMNEVLSPNWSPLSGGGQQDTGSMYDNGVRAGLLKPLPSTSGFGGGVDTPSPIAPIPTQAEVQLPQVTLGAPKSANPLYELGQRAGIFPQTSLVKPEAPQYSDNAQADTRPASQLSLAELGQRAGVLPSPAQQPAASTLAPGTVVDGSGKPVQVPDNYAWGKQEKQYVNGVEYYGARTPNGVYFKVGGPVPPTAAEKKDQRTLDKMDLQQQQQRQQSAIMLDDIDRVLKNTNGWTTGLLGYAMSGIPGGDAHNVSELLTGIGANISFNKLNEMRAASPTGGALGSVTEGEHRLLRSVYGSLSQSQTPEQFRYNLTRLKGVLQRVIDKGIPDAEVAQILGESYPQNGGNTAQNSTRLTFNPQTGRLE